jgi:hypothetical protein
VQPLPDSDPAGVPDSQPCLFCLQVGREPSIEHVFPGGLGLHADVVLPQGAVCEPCNNMLGRQVDEALVHLMEVRLIRGLHRVPDSKGRLLEELDLGNGTMKFSPEGGVNVVVYGDGDVQEVNPETIKVRVISRRRKSGDQWRRATRAVLKLGLNLAYLKLGADVALRDDWNPAREIIFGLPYEGYLLIAPFDIFKTPDLHGSLLFDVPGATALSQLRYGGLELLADLRPGPASPETRAWAEGRGMQVMDIAPRASA